MLLKSQLKTPLPQTRLITRRKLPLETENLQSIRNIKLSLILKMPRQRLMRQRLKCLSEKPSKRRLKPILPLRDLPLMLSKMKKLRSLKKLKKKAKEKSKELRKVFQSKSHP